MAASSVAFMASRKPSSFRLGWMSRSRAQGPHHADLRDHHLHDLFVRGEFLGPLGDDFGLLEPLLLDEPVILVDHFLQLLLRFQFDVVFAIHPMRTALFFASRSIRPRFYRCSAASRR